MQAGSSRMVGVLVALALAIPLPAAAGSVSLEPTGVEAEARGKARVVVYGPSQARFDVIVQRLGADSDYELVVDGIRVHTLRTNRGGRAKARFATGSRSERLATLGFDPRGAAVEIRDLGGENVLVATLPGQRPPHIACCIPHDSGDECEDRSADECADLGGTVSSAPSCLPDPCVPETPADPEVVCCNGPGECSLRTQPQCLAAGGSVIDALSCDADPCAPTPPPDPEVVCCLAADACVIETETGCVTAGGSVSDASSCDDNPCAPVGPPSCADNCWSGFLSCVNGCTSTYCAPFCQVDLGRCLDFCPTAP